MGPSLKLRPKIQTSQIKNVISADKMYVENWKNLQTFVWLEVWYYTWHWDAETLQGYLSKGVLSSAGIRF